MDRKTGPHRTIFVPQALVGVTGGIQPAILRRALSVELRESGLAARLLLAAPPRRPKRWTEADIDPLAEKQIAIIVERLYSLRPTDDVDGNPHPVVVKLTRDAKGVWKKYFNAHAVEQVNLTGELSAAWSKLEEYPARLALVIHFVRWAAEDRTLGDHDHLDAISMEAEIHLATWFKNEARRVYTMLDESDEGRNQRQFVEWIDCKGGSVTAREVQQGHRRYSTATAAENALNILVEAGYGQWKNTPATAKGGRPFRVFVLSTVYGTLANPVENDGSVDTGSVDACKPQPGGDDWGNL